MFCFVGFLMLVDKNILRFTFVFVGMLTLKYKRSIFQVILVQMEKNINMVISAQYIAVPIQPHRVPGKLYTVFIFIPVAHHSSK